AHFRFASVAIVIAHPEIRAVRPLFEQKNAIGANAAMPVANSDDLLRVELNVAAAIVDHDKIVSSAVHLGEAQHVGTVARPFPVVMSRRSCRRASQPPQFTALKRMLFVVASTILLARIASGATYNGLILDQMRKMPSGGKYSVSHFAKIKLQSAAHFESGK